VAVKASGKYTCVVKNQQIFGVKQVREIPEIQVLKSAILARKPEHSRAGALGQGLLRDQFLREMIVKIRSQHVSNVSVL
jgi:hypothetical protein